MSEMPSFKAWATEENCTVGRLDARDDFHERAFAGPILPDDGEHLAALQRQRNILQCLHARELLTYVARFKQEWNGGGWHRHESYF
jgi:hypothetical protein